MAFDHNDFRAAVFAAFVVQDWDTVFGAIALLDAVTGTTVLRGDPTPAQVFGWSQRVAAAVKAEAAYVQKTGAARDHLLCDNPDCPVHGLAVRRKRATTATRPVILLAAPVPGVQ